MDTSAIIAANADVDNALWRYLLFFGVIISGIQMGVFLHIVCESHLKKPFYSARFQLRNFIIDSIKEPLALSGVTTGIWLATFVLKMNESIIGFFNNLIILQIVVTLTWLVLRMFERFLGNSDMKLNLKSNQLSPVVIWKTQTTILDITITVVVLWIFDFEITPMLAGFGLSGLSITLARAIGNPLKRTRRSMTRKRNSWAKIESLIHDDDELR